MQLFKVKGITPAGGRRTIYIIANTQAEVELYIRRRRLQDPKVKLMAEDYGSGVQVVDCRTAGGKAAPIPVRLVARAAASDRVEQVKSSFAVRA
jgi:hypothetical protein